MTTVRVAQKLSKHLFCILTATGEDDDNEDQSPTKATKGKPGRKPGPTKKNTTAKDHDQEAEHEQGNIHDNQSLWL